MNGKKRNERAMTRTRSRINAQRRDIPIRIRKRRRVVVHVVDTCTRAPAASVDVSGPITTESQVNNDIVPCELGCEVTRRARWEIRNRPSPVTRINTRRAILDLARHIPILPPPKEHLDIRTGPLDDVPPPAGGVERGTVVACFVVLDAAARVGVYVDVTVV